MKCLWLKGRCKSDFKPILTLLVKDDRADMTLHWSFKKSVIQMAE